MGLMTFLALNVESSLNIKAIPINTNLFILKAWEVVIFLAMNVERYKKHQSHLKRHKLNKHDTNKVVPKIEDNVQSGIQLSHTECDKTFPRDDKFSKHKKDKHIKKFSTRKK